MKKLIVNADDFGITSGVNRGIIYGFQNGIITSASLMVKRPQAKEAAKLARGNPRLGVGLHFELVDIDKQILQEIRKIAYIGEAEEIGEKIMTPPMLKKAEKELHKQIELFKKLIGKMPDHIDGHHHIHKFPSLLSFILKFAKKYHLPLRGLGKIYFIECFSDTIETASVANLIKILRNLPDGVSELMTHPGYSSKELRKVSSMSDCREVELRTLTSSEIKKVIKEEGIKLISWQDVKMI